MSNIPFLRMTDVFPVDLSLDGEGGIGSVIDADGEFILQAMENNHCSHLNNRERNEYRNKVAKYTAHAIESHDELVGQRDALLAALVAFREHVPDNRHTELSSVDPYSIDQQVLDKIDAAIASAKAGAA